MSRSCHISLCVSGTAVLRREQRGKPPIFSVESQYPSQTSDCGDIKSQRVQTGSGHYMESSHEVRGQIHEVEEESQQGCHFRIGHIFDLNIICYGSNN